MQIEHWTPQLVAVLILGALLIGIAKAGFGGGPGMLVPPLVALCMEPKLAVGLILPLLLATDVIALRFFWGKWHKQSVLLVLSGAVVGIAGGTLLLGRMNGDQMKVAIGVLAIGLGGAQMLRDRLVPPDATKRPAPWLGVLAGLVCGVGSTLAHQGGVPVMLYLIPFQFDAVTFVGTTTAIFFFVNAAKVGPYVATGMIPAQALLVDLALLPFLYVGTLVGIRLLKVVPKEWFIRVVLWFVLATGAKLLWDGWLSHLLAQA